MDALYDMFLTIMLFCMITVGVHALLLLYWLCWANRKYYRWMAAHPTTPSAEADRKPMLGERGGDGYRWGAANPTVPSAEESVATEELVATEEATPLKFSSTAKGAKSTGDDPNDYSSSSSLSAVFAAAPVPSTAAMLHALRVQRSFRALLARRSVQARRAEVDEAAALARAAMFVQKMIRGRHSRAALQEVLRHRVAERSVVGIQRMWRLRQWRRTIAAMHVQVSHRAPPVSSRTGRSTDYSTKFLHEPGLSALVPSLRRLSGLRLYLFILLSESPAAVRSRRSRKIPGTRHGN